MKVGILCAGDREAAPFLTMIEQHRIEEKAMLTFHEGTIEAAEVVVLYSGVCKVNATIAAQLLIDSFGCDTIINAGTAGGMDERLELFDTVVCTETAYHDVAEHILTGFHPWLDSVWFHADTSLLEIARQAAANKWKDGRVFFGRMVTGEQFISDENREWINACFAPLSVDMETAAIAHVCYVNRVPFISVRSITDTARHSGAGMFEQNCKKASRISAHLVREILKRMKKT